MESVSVTQSQCIVSVVEHPTSQALLLACGTFSRYRHLGSISEDSYLRGVGGQEWGGMYIYVKRILGDYDVHVS